MIYSIAIFEGKTIQKQVFDVSKASFFYRNSIKELLTLFTNTFMSKVSDEVTVIYHEGYKITCGRSVCVISDEDYNDRVIMTLISESNINNISKFIKTYQIPENIDKITKIQKELDETITILHKTIDEVLDRGDKLDDIVKRSEDLSMSSQMFYKTAAKQNKCCVVS